MLRTLLILCVLTAACGGGSTAKPAPVEPVVNKQPEPTPAATTPMSPGDEALAGLERFEKDMCACPAKDGACAKRVSDAMNVWSQEMQAKHKDDKDPVPMTEEQGNRGAKIGTHLGECMQKAMGS